MKEGGRRKGGEEPGERSEGGRRKGREGRGEKEGVQHSMIVALRTM